MLLNALQKIDAPPSIKLKDVAALFNYIHTTNLSTTFPQHELPPPKIQNQYDALMIVVCINDHAIRHIIINNGSFLNVCSIQIFHRMGVDIFLIKINNRYIHGFDKIGEKYLGTITHFIKVGPTTFPTLIHVMPNPLSYTLLLSRPCIYTMKGVS